jgi:hypothetical protein
MDEMICTGCGDDLRVRGLREIAETVVTYEMTFGPDGWDFEVPEVCYDCDKHIRFECRFCSQEVTLEQSALISDNVT